LAGPSGCGKTEFYRVLRDYFVQSDTPDIAIACIDTSSLAAHGYKGTDPNEMIAEFAKMKNSDLGYGFIILDEFDKRLIPSVTGSGLNVSKEIQYGMLKIVEGGDIIIRVDKDNNKIINTERLCFIGMGSFSHFRKSEQTDTDDEELKQIGFNRELREDVLTETEKLFTPVSKDDIIDGGGAVELMARFSHVYNFAPLEPEYMLRIIDKVKGDVSQTYPHVEIIIEQGMVEYLISQANTKFGVRRIGEVIRVMVSNALLDLNMEGDPDLQETEQICVITLHDENNYTYNLRPMKSDEKEHYDKYDLEEPVKPETKIGETEEQAETVNDPVVKPEVHENSDKILADMSEDEVWDKLLEGELTPDGKVKKDYKKKKKWF